MAEFLGLTIEQWQLFSLVIGVFSVIIGASMKIFEKTTIDPLKQTIKTTFNTLATSIDNLREDLSYSRQTAKENDEKVFEKLHSHENRITYQEAVTKATDTRISKLEEKIK